MITPTNDELAEAYWDTAGRALARDIIAACDTRHRQEMEAYELTVENLRAELADARNQTLDEAANACRNVQSPIFTFSSGSKAVYELAVGVCETAVIALKGKS